MNFKSLRTKVMAVVATGLLLLFLVQYFAARYVLLRSYASLEQEKTTVAVRRALSLLEDNQSQLDGLASDWGAWDDTYAYIDTRDERFIESNFSENTFQHLRINASAIASSNGKILFSKGFDLAENRVVNPPDLLAQTVRLVRFGGVTDHVSGLIASQDGAWLVSSYPVLTSEGHGPVHGAMIMARKFDSVLVNRLVTTSHLAMSFLPISANLPDDSREAMDAIAAGTPIAVRVLDADRVVGYTIIKDLDGKPALLLRVETDRQIYAQGLSSFHFLFWSTLAIGLMLLAFGWLFDRLVLARLAKLSNSVQKIGEAQTAAHVGRDEPVGRVENDVGDDELASLTHNINGMLERLEDSQRFLRESEARDRIIFSSTGVIKLLLEVDSGKIVDVNPAACAYYGYRRQFLLGMRLVDITPNVAEDELLNTLHEALRHPGVPIHLQARLASGEISECDLHLSQLQAGERRLFYAIVFDVTERKRFEEALHLEKERAQTTLASIADAVITTDERGCISFMNTAAEHLTGLDFGTSRGKRLIDMVTFYKSDKREPVSIDWLINPSSNLEEIRLVRGDQVEFIVQKSAAPLYDKTARGLGAVTVLHDVTMLRALSHQLSFQSTHDTLTGLINRHEFDHTVQFALDDAKTSQRVYALAYLDLDKFKIVNESGGRMAGDELLRQITEKMKLCLRPGDTLARLGDDEFGLLLPDCTPDAAMEIAQELLQTITEFRFSYHDKMFRIGVSIGLIVLRPEDDKNLSQWLSAADIACHVAKEEGGNRIHVYQPGDREVGLRHSHIEWAARIGECMENDLFRVYWQPMRALKSGMPPHCELLIRMHGEDGKIYPPGAFLPAAERYHLMPQIDRWMVNAAFSIIARRGKDFPYICAINLSGQTLSEETFLEYVTLQLEMHGITPARICFEITETAVIGNLSRAKHFISRLRELGCHFSLDDFGSGLSSFGYLKNLEVDFLKVDGMFVRNIVHNPVDRAMVEAIRHVGHVMELQTIAEFVEDEQTIAVLAALGIDYAQGYAVARPELFE